MEIATFIISSLALANAVVGALFTGVQASAARRQVAAAFEQVDAAHAALNIERDRYHSERTPKIEGYVEFVDPPGHKLHIYLDSPESLATFDARIVEGDGVAVVGSEVLHEDDFRGGSVVSRWVRVDEVHAERLRLEAVCKRGDHSWTVPVYVPLFPELEERTTMFKCYFEELEPPPIG